MSGERAGGASGGSVGRQPGGVSIGLLSRIGAAFLALSEIVGGLALFSVQILKACLHPRLDSFETWRNFYRVGVKSLPIVATTAAFAGATAVIQTGHNVVKFRAYEVVGWAFGYSVFREIGPLLIGLMFSGRVGANNTAELGTMKVTEQLDAMTIMAIDPNRYLAMPRFWAAVLMIPVVTIFCDAIAIIGGYVASVAQY